MAHITYYGDLRSLTAKNEESIQAETLTELLNTVGSLYGKNAKKAAKSSLIVVNNEKVLSIRKVKLDDLSQVGFFPMCGGG